MKILGFMQNQWFRDPDKIRRTMAAMDPERVERYRRRLVAYALFAGCKSGRVLRRTFGDYCDKIIWEEASKELGGVSSAAFPADIEHIRSRIEEEKPSAIIAFGQIARKGVREALHGYEIVSLIEAPHPAARHPSTMALLREARHRLHFCVEVGNAEAGKP